MKPSLNNLLEVYRKASKEELDQGKNWYSVANTKALLLALKYQIGGKCDPTCGVIAALSPGSEWNRNLYDAETLINDYVRGCRGKDLPLVGSYGWRNIEKAESILGGADPMLVLGKRGFKTKSFYQCILNPSNSEYVVIDRHAKSAAYGAALPDDAAVKTQKEYDSLSRLYFEGAKEVGLLPCEFQAVVWVTWKRLKV